ncbi:MAG: GGDEF domain-containing protein [Pseudomonadota bacterium]
MPRSQRFFFTLAALAAGAILTIYAGLGEPKPPAQWKLIDIAGEASVAAMACIWFVIVLGSRPAGRATTLLACGLGGLMLGAMADCMDEFFTLAKDQSWSHLIESGVTLAGMVSLTWGLLYWRREQFMVTAHLQKRERLFQDHRSFDQLTQVGDADYLREQLRIEYERGGDNCCLLMLDIDSFHLVNRDFGQREGDRVLQAVTQVLLLNLRSTDLLCRYAGDRFAVLLSNTRAEAAHALADHLRRAVASLRHHAQRSGQAITPTIRYTFRNVDAEPRQLLKELNRALERRMPQTPYGQDAPAGVTVGA